MIEVRNAKRPPMHLPCMGGLCKGAGDDVLGPVDLVLYVFFRIPLYSLDLAFGLVD